MTRNRRPPQTRRRRRPPADSFDEWLVLVNALLIEPLVNVGRQLRKLVRRRRR